MRVVFCALVIAVSLLGACLTLVSAQEVEPVAVVNDFLAAENARNVDRALALFAEDAVVLYVPGIAPAVGKDAIRGYLENLVAGYVEVEAVETPQLVDGKVRWTEKLSDS